MQGNTRILIASSDPGIRESARRLLAFQEYGTLEASSGEECLALVRKEHPDIVYLDASLADASGQEVSQQVADDASQAGIKRIVFLSHPSRLPEPSPSADVAGSRLLISEMPAPTLPGELAYFFQLPSALLCTLNSDCVFRQVSRAWEDLLGIPSHELLAHPVLDVIHPDDREAMMADLRVLQEGGRTLACERRSIARNGNTVTLEWRALSVPADNAIYMAAVDRTGQRQAEDELRTLTRIVEQCPVSIMVTDTRGNIEYINPRFTEVSGFTPEEMVGKNPRVMKSGRQDQEVYKSLWGTITRGNVWRGALQNIKKNGELFWEYETIAPVRNVAGEITHYVSIKEDITDRRSAEEKIRSQATLLDAATDAIFVCDIDGRIVYWNKGAETTYGWSSEEAEGKEFQGLTFTDARQSQAALRSLLKDGAWSGEMGQQRKNGKPIVVEFRWSLGYDDSGRPTTILGIGTDITERKKLEAQFLRAQRMESIGTLAGGIAHDLNNILGPILLSIDFLRERNVDVETARVLGALESSANRGADLVRQVLMFARGVEGERVPIEPAALIKEVVAILIETFPRMIKIGSRVPEGLPTVMGDPTQLHQVLMNLCVNARDAMPDGGELLMFAEHITLDEHYARTNLEARIGPYVVISVTDTGVGIPADVVPRIFEPFFTTKEAGKGTGIGLSTVRAIVKSHGGFLNVYSEIGRGTTFKIYLPASKGGTDVKQAGVQQEIPRGNGELILVVDDEASILEVTKAALEAFGYRVVTAQDGTEALAVYSQRKGEIRVVLTDMMMPFLDGAGTIRALRKMDPEVKIIAVSGLDVDGKVSNIAGQINAFLPKPYTGETVLRTIRSVLTAKSV